MKHPLAGVLSITTIVLFLGKFHLPNAFLLKHTFAAAECFDKWLNLANKNVLLLISGTDYVIGTYNKLHYLHNTPRRPSGIASVNFCRPDISK